MFNGCLKPKVGKTHFPLCEKPTPCMTLPGTTMPACDRANASEKSNLLSRKMRALVLAE